MLILATASLCLFSCEQETELPSLEKQEMLIDGVPIQFNDGLASIATVEDAISLHSFFNKESADNVFTYTFPTTFTPAYAHYLQLEESDFTSTEIPAAFKGVAYLLEFEKEEYVEPVLEDGLGAFLANENAQLEIASEIYTFRPDRVVIIPNSDFARYSENPEDSPSAREIKYSESSHSDLLKNTNVDVCTSEYAGGSGTRRRVRGEIEANTGFLGNTSTYTIRVKTKHFRKGAFGRWLGERADRLQQNGQVELTDGTILVSILDRANIQSFNDILIENYPASVAFASSTLVLHTAQDIGGTANCFTQR